MPTQSKHASINIGLIQAREALMTQFRPILNQANITISNGGLSVFWRKTARWTFKIWRIRRAFCAPA